MKPLHTYIALFRGINVGGKNKLPMKELVTILHELGCTEVRTYIQSGNAVFQSTVEHAGSITSMIGNAIQQRFGFQPQIVLLSPQEIEAAITANPFPAACTEGNTLHLYFLAETAAKPNLDKLTKLQSDSEAFALLNLVFYLHAPDGIGRSKLAAGVEKALGVTVTARNWNSVCRILDLAQQTTR